LQGYNVGGPLQTDDCGNRSKILIVDDDDSIRLLFIKKLDDLGFKAYGASDGSEAMQLLTRFNIAVVILDQYLENEKGTDLLQSIYKVSPLSKVIFFTSHESVDLAVNAMSMGASGFLLKSVNIDENINRLIELTGINKTQSSNYKIPPTNIIGESESVKLLLNKIVKVNTSNATILITGESGVGKEMFAKAIHDFSDRKNNPFIAINCGAISESLLEAELFGYKKGAFTDAKEDRKGFFETCSNGTLLLDEVGEMSPSLQVKLLRVLQEKEVTPVGARQSVKINTRVIAATNRNLFEEIKNEKFREDLYFRLAVIHLEIPPLRHRLDDIPLFVEYFLEKFNRQFNKKVKAPSSEIYSRFNCYDWPGNIRELYNALERAVLLTDTNEMRIEDLLPHKQLVNEESAAGDKQVKLHVDYGEAKDAFERAYVENLLKTTNYNITDAAKISNQYRTNIYRLIKKHGIQIDRHHH
jgi:DNA-binding NtrC family response regulator